MSHTVQKIVICSDHTKISQNRNKRRYSSPGDLSTTIGDLELTIAIGMFICGNKECS